jgi:hypothetical protein
MGQWWHLCKLTELWSLECFITLGANGLKDENFLSYVSQHILSSISVHLNVLWPIKDLMGLICIVTSQMHHNAKSSFSILSPWQLSTCNCFWPFLYNFLLYFMVLLPPLWSSGQSSWLQIQRSWFDSRRYQIYWEVVGLERGPLRLVSTIEEELGRKSSGSGLESRESRDPYAHNATPSIRKSWH